MKNNSEQPTFYIHDYETFGQHPALDRPAQFAGVRTDMDFNIIEEPLVIYCSPADDYLPQPEAVMITGITPQIALEKGVNEAEFARQIHNVFSVPNSCILGYNNIRFDDEVSRNIFYRNFYDPYAYSWQKVIPVGIYLMYYVPVMPCVPKVLSGPRMKRVCPALN